jgi:hypothetical protein
MSGEDSDADPEDFWSLYENEESIGPGSPLKGSPDMKRMGTSKLSSPTKFFLKN